jgi:citrate synthase
LDSFFFNFLSFIFYFLFYRFGHFVFEEEDPRSEMMKEIFLDFIRVIDDKENDLIRLA